MSANLLEKARANRTLALKNLERRKGKLVILGDASDEPHTRPKKAVFVSCRAPLGVEITDNLKFAA